MQLWNSVNLICESSCYNNHISLAGRGSEDNSIPVIKIVSTFCTIFVALKLCQKFECICLALQTAFIRINARRGEQSFDHMQTLIGEQLWNICIYGTDLSMSYLGAAMCIISTAQHANPNVRGHREPFLKVMWINLLWNLKRKKQTEVQQDRYS